MKYLETAKAVVLDFDGTLVDSNPIKLKAFDACFSEFAEWEEIKAYCYTHHHTPRWEKFRHVYENILKRPYTEKIEEILSKRYEEATTQKIIGAPEIKGSEAFLKKIKGKFKIALVSSTPAQFLNTIVAARGWMDYFDVVQGSPVVKSEWVAMFSKDEKIGVKDIVFFGDSNEDFQSAKKAGCVFVGVANEALAEKGVPFIKNFDEVNS